MRAGSECAGPRPSSEKDARWRGRIHDHNASNIIITMREGAAEGRPLPHFYPYIDSLACMFLELHAMGPYACTQRGAPALYARTQRDRMPPHPMRRGGGTRAGDTPRNDAWHMGMRSGTENWGYTPPSGTPQVEGGC